MSGPLLKMTLRALCWLVVVLELVFGFLMLVLLGTTEVYGHVPFGVTVALLLGFAPILAGCVATRNPRRASRIALWPAPLVVLFLYSRLPFYSFYLPVRLIFAMAPTLLPGLFWFVAARQNWPLPFSTEPFSRRPFLGLVSVISLVFIMLVGSVALSLLLPWWPAVGDCGTRPILDEKGKPLFLDFTTRILFVGPRSFHGYSLFAVARVKERFSDSIWAIPKFVILRDFFHETDPGEDFFVEGRRSRGPFTRFLPVVERVECGHSYRVAGATIALRTLRGGPPRSGVRIIGAVNTSQFKNSKPLPGVEVLIKGPAGTTVAVTDNDGIYDVSGLPFGQYTVELLAKGVHPICALNLEKQAVDGCSLFLDGVHGP